MPADSPSGLVAVPHSLVLRAWEAVSTERSLQRVLEAVADVLLPAVPFNGVALISLSADDGAPLAAHIAGHQQRDDETVQEYLNRPEFNRVHDVPTRPLVPYDDIVVTRAFAGEPYMCPDLLAKDSWYEHEFRMASGGVRCYASVPLLVRGTLIGTAAFSRVDPIPFSPTELAILKAVARALAVAVSNALAYDEIRRLRDQANAENLELRAQLGQSPWFEDIVGDSPPMRRMLERVEQVATTDATVLITGETGTGKELVARAIHQRSPRAREPFIKVHCAAVPETLLASELFGHERGAFTGALERRRGRFELADRGTIFLDEIGELSPDTQVTLLRVLQEREFERLGGSRTVKVDVRIVAATNRDLAADVGSGRFRRDLFYRLNVFPVPVPPLREHPEDIAALVAHFAAKYAARFKRGVTRVSSQTLRELTAREWPGNVRELEHVIERAVIVSTGGTLQLEHDVPAGGRGVAPLVDQVAASERAAIEAALSSSRGRVSGPRGAAQRLDMPASTLEFRIRKLGIDKFRFRRELH